VFSVNQYLELDYYARRRKKTMKMSDFIMG